MMFEERARNLVLNKLRLRAIGLARHYQRLFRPEGVLARDAEIVLADLREYCRAQASTFGPDARNADRLQGRREVWLRIAGLLNLNETETYKLMEIDDGD